jgi:hypothetical protein
MEYGLIKQSSAPQALARSGVSAQALRSITGTRLTRGFVLIDWHSSVPIGIGVEDSPCPINGDQRLVVIAEEALRAGKNRRQ